MSGNKLNENENNSKFKSQKKSVNKSNKFESSIKKHHNNIGGNGPIALNGVSRTSMDAYCTSLVHLEVSQKSNLRNFGESPKVALVDSSGTQQPRSLKTSPNSR